MNSESKKMALLLLAACICLILIGPASAAIIYVPANQPTIQAAINSAADGDTIYVAAGTYDENVIVNKSVTLIGSSLPVVNGSYTDDVFNVTADDVTITGFEIVASGSDYNQDDDCIPTGCDSAIKLYYVSGATVTDNVITDCLAGVNGVGVSDVFVDGNDIFENHDGIYMHVISGTNTFTNNDASFNEGPGLHIHNVTDGTYLIDDNVFINESTGIHIHNVTTGSFTITDNDARYNSGASIHIHQVGGFICGSLSGIIPLDTGDASFIIERNQVGMDDGYTESYAIENAPESEGADKEYGQENEAEKGGKESCKDSTESAAEEKCKSGTETSFEERGAAGPLEAFAEKCKEFLFGQSSTESSGEKKCKESESTTERWSGNGVGIHVHQVYNGDNYIRIADNSIANTTAGIHVHQFYGNNTEIAIENNDLTYVGAAIHVHQIDDLVSLNIDDNDIVTAWAAIHVHNMDGEGSEYSVTGNEIEWYVNEDEYAGIHLHNLDDAAAFIVNDNSLIDAQAAIHLHNLWGYNADVQVNGNDVDDAQAAIHLHNIWTERGEFTVNDNWVNDTENAGIHLHNLDGGVTHEVNGNTLENIGRVGIHVHRIFPMSGPLYVNNNIINNTGRNGILVNNLHFATGFISGNTVTYAGCHGILLNPFMGDQFGDPLLDESGTWTITENNASFNDQAGIAYHRHYGFSHSVITENVGVDNGCHGLLLIMNNGTVVRDNVFNGNVLNGITLKAGTGVTIMGNELNDNSGDGLEINETWNSYTGSFYGCHPGNATAIRVTSNMITGNALSGIELVNTSANLIYNNYFNQTDNVLFNHAVYNNTWNTTVWVTGPNIVGGPFISGNFWVTPAGDGWSETHDDSDHDGFCDEEFNFYGNETDFYPLHAPYADFTQSGRSGTAPYTVTFTDTSGLAGVPADYYNWTFGDGSGATFRTTTSIQHTYTVPGIYDVTMYVTSIYGDDMVVKTDWIYVYQQSLGTGGGGATGGGTTPPSGTESQGITTEETTVTASDGIGKLTVPSGTQALDSNGNPIAGVGITPLSEIPKEPEGLFSFAGYAWQCTPAGATFDPPITMTLTFTAEEWAALDPAAMSLQWYNPATGLWETIPAIIDPVSMTVTAQISHFSVFAIFEAAEEVVIVEEEGEVVIVEEVPTTEAPTTAPTTQSPLVFAPVLALGAIPFLLRRK